jgi:hypothetical protein
VDANYHHPHVPSTPGHVYTTSTSRIAVADADYPQANDSLRALPFLPLEVGGDEMFNLPVSGLDAVGEVLAHTAKRSTHWHDGFHLLQADPLRLTHLCQFISPPLPKAGDSVPRASGARHMTALLASRVAGIVAVAILTQERVASIYEAGTRTKSEPLT